jgi:hypothetical protein
MMFYSPVYSLHRENFNLIIVHQYVSFALVDLNADIKETVNAPDKITDGIERKVEYWYMITSTIAAAIIHPLSATT